MDLICWCASIAAYNAISIGALIGGISVHSHAQGIISRYLGVCLASVGGAMLGCELVIGLFFCRLVTFRSARR